MIQWDLKIPHAIWPAQKPERVHEFVDLYGNSKIIFHSPSLSHLLHEIPISFSDPVAIVWLRRDFDELYESGLRVNWNPSHDLGAYYLNVPERKDITRKDIWNLKEAKEELWEKQKKDIPYWFEIEYESLKEHSFWVEKEERSEFHVRQISENSPIKIIEGKTIILEPDSYGDLKSLRKEFPK